VSQTELERGVSEVLIDEDRLRSRVVELGEEISADYAGRDLLLIGVLKGAVFFMADLMRTLAIPCEIDFMAISSYGAQTDSSGVVRSAQTSSVAGSRASRFRIRYDRVSPESMMSSTTRTLRPSMLMSRSLRILTTPDESVCAP
jgi:hypothetical protein